VTAEEAKVKIMQTYLPQPLTDQELEKIVTKVLHDLGTVSNPGQAIGAVMKVVAGKAEGSRVSALVTQKLKQ
jgi:uncharacterized protein YqeY